MARIVIVAASESARAQLQRLLGSSGFDVFRVCAAGGELRRAMNACEDGVVVLSGIVPGCSPDELAEDFGDRFQILLIARPEALDACESPKIFKLAYPCSGSAVLGSVEMLSQLHVMSLPRRTGEEKALVDRAKTRLMRQYGIPEPEAHRRMQQTAMRRNMRLTEYARLILREAEDL